MKIGLSLLLLCSLNAYANDQETALLFKPESLNSIPASKVRSNPDVYQQNESLLRDSSGEDGLYTEEFYTKKDTFRVSLGYQIAQDFKDFSSLSVIDVQFHKKIASYKDQWWGLQFKSIKGNYDVFAEELDTSSDPTSDRSVTRDDNEQSLSMIGLGLGYRFKALTAVFNSDRIFENVMAFGNYVTNQDATNSKKYIGYGLTAEYSIQRRVSEALFFNFKMGYNLASLSREAEDKEKKEDRSLVFKWTTLGFDFGYYF
jgi:hypothetical protein